MKADIMRIRRELDAYDKQNVIDIAIRFLNDEQVVMIQHIIDATFWMKLFAQNKEEVAEVKKACELAGI